MSNLIYNFFPFFLSEEKKELYRKKEEMSQYNNWLEQGKPVPAPHIVKQMIIKEYQEKTKCDILVETGTFLGDMIHAQMDNFSKIYSIELSEKLYQKAKKRFLNKDKVILFQGDSSDVLGSFISEFKKPVLFWLDGHYSGGITAQGKLDCPIYEELKAIFKTKIAHIILIDDARCFEENRKDYPTIKELTNFIQSYYPQSVIEIKDDVIRVQLEIS